MTHDELSLEEREALALCAIFWKHVGEDHWCTICCYRAHVILLQQIRPCMSFAP